MCLAHTEEVEMIVETTLSVTGMTCGSCVRHIQAALAQLGVEHAAVDLSKQTVAVRHDDDSTPVGAVVEAIARSGYAAVVQA